MRKILNRNEITVIVIALMLITAGYLDYIGKENTSEVISQNIIEDIANNEIAEIEISEEIAKTGEAKLVDSEVSQEDEVTEVSNTSSKDNLQYFLSAKLERTNMYSQIIDNYQEIINNPNVSESQKSIATQEITKVNQEQNAIMVAEKLLLAKGFENCIIFVNEGSISVIIGKETLEPSEIAQIQNIVSRELNVEIGQISIANK